MVGRHHCGTRKSELPHHSEPLTVVEEWSDSGHQYRLVERGGIYRLEVHELYRWVSEANGLQAIARRYAEMRRAEQPSPQNVVELKKERRV